MVTIDYFIVTQYLRTFKIIIDDYYTALRPIIANSYLVQLKFTQIHGQLNSCTQSCVCTIN